MKNITTYLDKISEEYYQKFMSRVNSSEKISIEDQLKTIKEIICCSSLQYDLQVSFHRQSDWAKTLLLQIRLDTINSLIICIF